MRKYIIGGIVGLVMGFSATAYADDIQSLIGKTIQGQAAIYLDGQPLDTAIIVDGKSYAPTRKVAEASGQTVTFNEGGIYLESTSTPTPESTPEPTPTNIVDPAPTPTPETYNIELINSEIQRLTLLIDSINGTIEWVNKNTSMTEEKREQSLNKLHLDLSNTQAELDTWNQRKAELEAQQ